MHDTRSIFHQLAQSPSDPGLTVKTVIENHDAWTRTESVHDAFTAATRARMTSLQNDPVTHARLLAQREKLAPLTVPLSRRQSSAG